MIKTESGYVSGLKTKDGTVSIFKGIPYAAPPEGHMRWKTPEKFSSWPGIRECTKFSPSAIQPPQAPFLMWTEEFIIDTSRGYSEDSLSLNIYCPSDQGRRSGVRVQNIPRKIHRKRDDVSRSQKVQPLDEEIYKFWRDIYCVN